MGLWLHQPGGGWHTPSQHLRLHPASDGPLEVRLALVAHPMTPRPGENRAVHNYNTWAVCTGQRGQRRSLALRQFQRPRDWSCSSGEGRPTISYRRCSTDGRCADGVQTC
jgi:hypothetical protein